MSAPYEMPPDPRLPFARFFSWFMPNVPKPPPDWQDASVAEKFVEYPAFPTRGIAELNDLLGEMRQSLPHIRCPVLLAQSHTDGTVAPENMQLIYEKLDTADKTMFWLEKSSHVVTFDQERQRMFEAASEFVRRVSQAG